MKMTTKALSIFVALCGLVFLSSGSARAAPPDFSLCDSLSGAAWGLCRGGVAAGCADGSGNMTTCSIIEENFSGVTGIDPPWVAPLPVCPCDFSTIEQTIVIWPSTTTQPVEFRCPTATSASVVAALGGDNRIVTNSAFGNNCVSVIEGVLSANTDLPDTELQACRADVIEYGNQLVVNPDIFVNKLCSE